jgi:hypothetical protein
MSEPPRSRAFWPAVAFGTGLAAVGAVVAFDAPPDDGRPLGILAVVAGAIVAHDFLIAPATYRVGAAVSRRWRAGVAGPLRAALAISAVVVVFALPLVAGLGGRPTNDSALPLPYARSLIALLAVVWLSAAAVIAIRVARRR